MRNPNETEVVEVAEQEVDVYYPKIKYCPACGSASIQREERAMERVYHLNRYTVKMSQVKHSIAIESQIIEKF